MIKGSVLFYTLIFSIIIALSLGMLLSLFLNFNKVNSTISDTRAFIDNIESTRELITAEPSLFSENQTIQIDLFNDRSDSVEVTKRRHGLLETYLIKAFKGKKYFEMTFLMGWTSQTKLSSLFLSNSTYPISVCGNTYLEGPVNGPKTKMKRAYIEGQSYQNGPLLFGEYSTKQAGLPKLEHTTYSNCLNSHVFNPRWDTAVEMEALQLGQNSFQNKRWVIRTTSDLYLENVDFQGNLLIQSSAKITIHPSSYFKDVIFIAPEIEVVANTVGEFQCLASNNIQIGNGVELTYPSNLLVINDSPQKNALHIGKDVLIEGAVVVSTTTGNQNRTPNSILKIGENVKIKGWVFASGRTTISENIQIQGHFYSNELQLKTPSAVYTNHLLNFKVEPSKIPKYYTQSSPYLGAQNPKLLKWLN